MKIKTIIILLILLLTASCNMQKPSKFVTDHELVVLEGQHELLRNSGQIAFGAFNFSHTFKLNPDLEQKIQLGDDEFYTYFVNTEDSKIIKGEYVVDTYDREDSITFIALQGNKLAMVRTLNEHEWHSSLLINSKPNATTKLPLEIMWDPKGLDEIIIVPIKNTDQNYYDGFNQGVIRAYIASNNIPIERALIDKQNNINKKIYIQENKGILPHPIPTWINDSNQQVGIIKDKDRFYFDELPTKIMLGAVSYNTTMDILHINDSGLVEIIKEGLEIKEGRVTYINLPKEFIAELNTNKGRDFLLLVNNRGKELLADIEAIKSLGKPFSTSFQILMEFNKLKP